MIPPSARDRFLDLLRPAVQTGALSKLTLGKPTPSAESGLRNLFVRPVILKTGPHLAFVRRYATRDVTKNLLPDAALAELESLLSRDFLDAHLFTPTQHAQFESQPDGSARLKTGQLANPLPSSSAPAPANDRVKTHLIPHDAPWLRALGITNDRGQPREGMADKFRQIQKFAELLTHLLADVPAPPDRPLRIVDMGSGKGYLTFAVAALLGARATVRGIEVRRELVDFCNRVAHDTGLAPRLQFSAGAIAETSLQSGDCDVLIALHACDTATDDALARGLAADARLLVVAPCCQKELRRQLTSPPVLANALRHGIFQERQSEFVTDALRAQLLECSGYRTKVFEFISTEHTAKNTMIAATKLEPPTAPDPLARERLQAFAAFYGIRHQRLATHLAIPLSPGT